jgi:hypothetical protein
MLLRRDIALVPVITSRVGHQFFPSRSSGLRLHGTIVQLKPGKDLLSRTGAPLSAV